MQVKKRYIVNIINDIGIYAYTSALCYACSIGGYDMQSIINKAQERLKSIIALDGERIPKGMKIADLLKAKEAKEK